MAKTLERIALWRVSDGIAYTQCIVGCVHVVFGNAQTRTTRSRATFGAYIIRKVICWLTYARTTGAR